MSNNGYFHSTNKEDAQAAADQISQEWLDDIPDEGNEDYKSVTIRWATVQTSVDGLTFFTEKRPPDNHNKNARAMQNISESAGQASWFPEE